jgi:gliding motility-associated-like protein
MYIPSRAGILDVRMHHRLCGVVDSLKVLISECPEPEICDVYLPTAFTPNYDGINDTWQVHTPCQFSHFHMELFDQWGELVFATNHHDVGWDGSFRGQLLSSGVFTGYIKYKWEGIEQEFQQGIHIHLVR